jgi:hypothetical protein
MFQVICIDEQEPRKQWDSLGKPEFLNITIKNSSFLFQDGSFKICQNSPDCIDLLIIHESALSSDEKNIIKDTLCQEQYNFCTLLVNHDGLDIQNFSNFKLHYSNIPFPNVKTLSHLSDRLFQLIDKLKNSNSFSNLDEMKNVWHLWENPYDEEIITALNILCQGYLIACQKLVTFVKILPIQQNVDLEISDNFSKIKKLSNFDISNPIKYCLKEEEEQYCQYSEIPSQFVCDAISYMRVDISNLEIDENVYGKMMNLEYWRTPFVELFISRKITTENERLDLFQKAWNYSQKGRNNSTLDKHLNHLFKFVAGNSKTKLYPSIVAKAYLAINDPNYVI